MDGPGTDGLGNDLERELAAALESGTFVGPDDSAKAAGGAGWGPERTVDAEVLCRLLGPARKEPVRALRLRGARIAGRLDLEGCELRCPVVLERCYFEESPLLDEARVPALRMPDSHVPGLSANQLDVRGDLK